MQGLKTARLTTKLDLIIKQDTCSRRPCMWSLRHQYGPLACTKLRAASVSSFRGITNAACNAYKSQPRAVQKGMQMSPQAGSLIHSVSSTASCLSLTTRCVLSRRMAQTAALNSPSHQAAGGRPHPWH